MKKKDPNRFYVYVYLDPRKSGKYNYREYEFDYEPFYIGKGENKRSHGHIKEAKNILETGLKISKKNFPNANRHKIRKILKIYRETGCFPIINFLEKNLSEQCALEKEKHYVKTIGRYDYKKGPLTNHTDGGDGGCGRILTKESIEKSRKAHLEPDRKSVV